MDELLYYDLKDVSGLTRVWLLKFAAGGRRIITGHFPGSIYDDENDFVSI